MVNLVPCRAKTIKQKIKGTFHEAVYLKRYCYTVKVFFRICVQLNPSVWSPS